MTATRPDPSVDLSELERDYIVKRELGKGGMGAVFLARHRTAGHDVAIKVISSKFIADADALSRFEREARLMARIRHPNIVHQYELRRLGGGHVALVMQYVRGEPLIAILRTGSSTATSSRTTFSSTPTKARRCCRISESQKPRRAMPK